MEERGLLLAAKAVERLDVVWENREFLEVRLIVEKEYPKDMEVPLMDEQNSYVMGDAGKELLKQFSQRVAGGYGKEYLAFCFSG